MSWSRPSVVSRGVPLPSFAKGSSSGPKGWCPASGGSEPRARLCDLDAGDEGAERASSSETCIFVECIQSTKAQLCTGWGKWRNYAPGCDLAHEEGSTVSQACRPAKAVERLLRANIWAPITCQYSGAYGINIRGLGGKTCHCTGCGNIEI